MSLPQKFAMAIAVPRENKPQRFPTFPSLEKTATIGFTDTTTFAVSGADKAYAFLVRDPALPLWLYRAPHTSAYSIGAMLPKVPVSTANLAVWNALEPTTVTAIAANASIIPSGCPAAPILRYHERNYYAALAANFLYQIRFAADPGTVTTSVTLELIDERNDIVEYSPPTEIHLVATGTPGGGIYYTGGLFPFPVGTLGFRVLNLSVQLSNAVAIDWATSLGAPAYGCGTTSTSNYQPISSPAGTVLKRMVPMVGPNELRYSEAPWQSVRCNASAVLFSNVTAVLAKEGTVNAARLQTENVGMFNIDGWETFMARASPSERYFGPMEKGLYTYTLPDAGNAEFREILCHGYEGYTEGGASRVQLFPSVIFDMDKIDYFHPIVFSDLDGASTSTMAVTVDRHNEFKTSSVLFPTGYSTATLESYHHAQMILLRHGVFFENPVHLAAIGRMIMAGARLAAPYVRPIAVRALQTLAGVAAQKMTEKFGQMTQRMEPGNTASRGQPRKRQNNTTKKRVVITARRPRRQNSRTRK